MGKIDEEIQKKERNEEFMKAEESEKKPKNDAG